MINTGIIVTRAVLYVHSRDVVRIREAGEASLLPGDGCVVVRLVVL